MPESMNIDWKIESIRLTCFTGEAFNPTYLEEWLTTASKSVPVRVNKSTNSFNGISRSMGSIIKVDWNGTRLDIVLSSDQPQENPFIGTISDFQRKFREIFYLLPSLKEIPKVDRLALGLVVASPVSTEKEGLSLLNARKGTLKIDESIHDFLIRFNHFRDSSTISGLIINQLATFSVGKTQLIEIKIKNDGTQNSRTLDEGSVAVRLELDINTEASKNISAGSDSITSLMQEFEQIALNIASGKESGLLI